MANTNKSHRRVQALCEGALMVALAQILGYLKFYRLPNGGSWTLVMFPIFFYAVRWGWKHGLLAGFTLGLLQLFLDTAYTWGWQSIFYDYLLAYTALGLAGLFKGKKWGIFAGAVVGGLGRYFFVFLSGVTCWRITAPTEIAFLGTFENPELYSLLYNGMYVIPSIALALIAAGVLYVPLKKYFLGQDIQ